MNRLPSAAPRLFLLFLAVGPCLYGQVSDQSEATIAAGDLTLSFDDNGAITRLVDADSGTDYSVENGHASLVGLVTGTGAILNPNRFTFENRLYRYRFAGGISVEVKADATPDYITFEVIDFQNDTQQEIVALFWRIDSSLRGTVAETAGIIYDDVFAVGLMGLNTKTSGGWFEVVPPPTPIDKWHDGGRQDFQRTAIPTSFGSQLRAVTGNYTTSSVRLEGKIKNSQVSAATSRLSSTTTSITLPGRAWVVMRNTPNASMERPSSAPPLPSGMCDCGPTVAISTNITTTEKFKCCQVSERAPDIS